MSDTGYKRLTRGRARAERIASRTAKVQPNPAPPGPAGGQYQPLTDADVQKIVATAFHILATIGMGDVPAVLAEKATQCGATLTPEGRLLYPQSMVEDIIDGAAKSFMFYGRDSKHDIEVGGDRVYYGTGGAAVRTQDLDTGDYRESTLQDLYDFTRLADTRTNISWFTRCCIATDIHDIHDLDINTAYTLAAGTTKPVGTAFTLGSSVDPIIDMFDRVLGSTGKFAEKPFCKAHISPVISPLKYGDDAVEVTTACIKRRVPINAIIAAQSGATAPATLAGMLAQTTAETLAALIMVNVFERGYPMIFSNWPLVIDLRTGSFAGGSGEIALLNAGAAQISNWLGLPSGVASSMSDAKAVDAQMGAEKALTAVTTGLAGANMVYESSGMTASLLGASFEAFVIDNEMLSHAYRMIRGIEVNDETLAFDAIEQAVNGEGHFLGSMHTMDAMQRDHFYPELANRDDPRTWSDNGSVAIHQTANKIARDILTNHKPHYIDDVADAAIRQHYNILLPRQH